jgi:hypothetical protein
VSEEKNHHKVQIWIALIGLVGVLGTALIANYDKISPSYNDELVSDSTNSNSDEIDQLSAPIPNNPECSKPIKTPPDDRLLVLGWKPTLDASTYTVEVDCFGCSEYGKTWHSLSAGAPWHIRTGLGLRTPIYSSKIHIKKKENDGLALRWRVWAIDQNGVQGRKSDWCKLTFYGS